MAQTSTSCPKLVPGSPRPAALEGRVEPVTMGHSALGASSTLGEALRGLRVSPTGHEPAAGRQQGLDTSDAAITSAYREHDRRIRLKYSDAACLLIAVLVPVGSCLDYFMYPALLGEFALARLAVGGVACAVLVLQRTLFGARHVRLLALVPPLVTNVAICWMIYRTEGSASPYYAGLNLVLFGVATLLPWSFLEALLVAAVTLALYSLASFAWLEPVLSSPIFFNNVYFMVLASVICCTAAFMKSRARRAEFELQAQLARKSAQLTHMERLKTQFFANISHELRTPLTLILSPLEDSLRRSAGPDGAPRPSGPLSAPARLDAPTSELLGIAYQNALRLLKLINDLLEFVRIDTSTPQTRRELVEMGQFVHAQVEALRPLASPREQTLELVPCAEPLWVSADPSHLERILVNLLTNAIKYTPPRGRVCVRLSSRLDSVLLEVIDTGIGISQEDQSFIFNRFRQADNARTMSARGMGIGLALAKELCEENDGKISVKSRIGEGTTMAFELPRLAAPPALPAASARETSAVLGDPITRFSLKADRQHPEHVAPAVFPGQGGEAPAADAPLVLVVDDEPDMRKYVCWTLASAYRVHEENDGKAGLSAALRLRPAVVVVDQMMPEMEGLEMCLRLREEPDELRPRVIMITARSDDMTRLNALASGADDFLEKPFSGPELALRVSNLVRARGLEQSLRVKNQELEAALERITVAELELVANEKFAALGRMAGGLLHELNNPLNNALMAISVAKERAAGQDAQSREVIADVETGMQRVRDVVASVRAFSHPSNTQRPQPLLLGRVIDVARAQTRGDLEEIELWVEPSEDVWVLGVEAQLIQVLTNLLTNAAEALHRSERRGRVEVRVDVCDATANVQVLDNGPGIPEDLRSRVLEPFVTSKAPGQGMGLGLSICDRLVRNHGSGITVGARPEGGTMVSFALRRSEPISV
jgi:signal transduction histidine kinase